jgi:TrpR-related protein YerC/YecD
MDQYRSGPDGKRPFRAGAVKGNSERSSGSGGGKPPALETGFFTSETGCIGSRTARFFIKPRQEARGKKERMQIDKLRGRELDQLFEAILSLRNLEECYRFFDDLCTVNELLSLSQRLEVARMLKEGATYHEIEEKTGASTATISRVKRCLQYGSDGYQLVLRRMKEKQGHPEGGKG